LYYRDNTSMVEIIERFGVEGSLDPETWALAIDDLASDVLRDLNVNASSS
jgi:hypothetical protein